MSGILYGVGVGPGDAELMTLKAVRIIREADVIAVPGTEVSGSIACQIAVQAVPEMAEKEKIAIPMPMTHDHREMERRHADGAERIEKILSAGKNLAFLTLGDPAVYSTFFYLQKRVAADGFRTETVSGVPSFCAAAAEAGIPLAEGREVLHIIPAAHGIGDEIMEGTCVYMKAGRKLGAIREKALAEGKTAVMVENCGMEGERICRGAEEMPEEAGYYTLVIVR